MCNKAIGLLVNLTLVHLFYREKRIILYLKNVIQVILMSLIMLTKNTRKLFIIRN